ncbi:putative MATE efflux family protein subfamily [Ilyonectria destructans]|nr:putative MATE efflux family protein subfamily [Ilyonectria destructans]
MQRPHSPSASFRSSIDDTRTEPDERTSLLRREHHGSSKKGLALSVETRRFAIEFLVLCKLSLPVIASYILQNSLQTISIIIVGRSRPQDLTVAAFAYMFGTCSGWLIGQGGSTALDTLASASFTGSSNKHHTGVLLQRAFIVLTLFYLPVCIIWFYSESLFRMLGQDARLSHDSARFLTCLIPGGLGYIYFEIMKKYLQAQGIIQPATYIMLAISPLSALLNHLFVNTFGIGLMGAPLATGVCYWLSFLTLVLYAKFFRGHECWGGWTWACLRNLGIFARIAALGIIQLGTEFWAFEIVALVAGRLGELPLAGQSVLMTADQVLVTIPFGIGVATSVRVGNALGAKDKKSAKRFAHTSVILSIIIASMVLLVLVLSRHHFAKLFTTDPDTVQYVARVLPWVALF